MPSQLQSTSLGEIKWDDLTVEQLEDIRDNDDRDTAKKKATDLLAERNNVNVTPITEYDPRKDFGPKRPEDEVDVEDETPLSAEEVPLEASRKDETTLLATDTVRVDDDGEIVIVK